MQGRVCAIIAAAGSGSRMGGGENKLFLPLGGRSILRRTVEAFVNHGEIDTVTVVHAPREAQRVREELADFLPALLLVPGGGERYQSVFAALQAQPEDCEIVLIHDGARPFVSGGLISTCISECRRWGSAVAGVPVKDTVKRCDEEAFVEETPQRKLLWSVQTPQTFYYKEILQAYGKVDLNGATDDASVLERAGGRVKMIMGSYRNIKITTPEDMETAEAFLGKSTQRTGMGYDVHAFAPERALMLGGVHIPHEKGLLGHSDADVLVHAVMDALLGAAALGDIGQHFPDTDPAYRGISSLLLLTHVGDLLHRENCSIINISAVVLAQRPKLAPFIPEMRKNISAALGIEESCLNIAATTTEGLGFVGRQEGIAAQAVALIAQRAG